MCVILVLSFYKALFRTKPFLLLYNSVRPSLFPSFFRKDPFISDTAGYKLCMDGHYWTLPNVTAKLALSALQVLDLETIALD